MTQKRAVRGKRASGFSSRGKIWVGVIMAVVVILGAALGLQQRSIARPAGDTLTAESTSFDFGQVRMTGGLIRTKFPLTVRGNLLVTGLVAN